MKNVVNPRTKEKDDIMQDFVSIITSLYERLYGKRRTKRQTNQRRCEWCFEYLKESSWEV